MKDDLRQRTMQFAFEVVQAFARFPRQTDAQLLGKQLLKSGTSVGANYGETDRGRSGAEFIAKCGDCLREAAETAYGLDLIVLSNVIPAEKLAAVRKGCSDLIAISWPSLGAQRRNDEGFSSFIILTSSFASSRRKCLVDPICALAK